MDNLNRKYQHARLTATKLQVKLRKAEQEATFAEAFIDKLLKENRVTKNELKEFRSSLNIKNKEEIRKTLHEKPHYKAWRKQN